MTAEARRTLARIRYCIETERYAVNDHFTKRMQRRALFWPDVLAVIYDPKEVLSDGMDDFNRPKWKISGEAADIREIEIVCTIESIGNETEETEESETEFITLYWEE